MSSFTPQEMKDLSGRVFVDFLQMKTFSKDPLILVEGDGIYVTDHLGKRYMDGLAGVFTNILGYGYQPVIDAINEQMQKLHFGMPMYSTNDKSLELAEMLSSVTPSEFNKMKFLSGGSEATEAAMKMARQYHRQTGNPGKYKVVSRYGSYHGGTMGALAASGGAARKSHYEPFATGYVHVPPPFCYRCPFNLEFPSCDRLCAGMIEDTIINESPDTVAAVIAEPIIVSGDGFIPSPPGYLSELRRICDKHNVVLIFDEIITGVGRLGHMFGADLYDVWPDILVVGKAISAGYYPLSAVILNDQVAGAFWGDESDMVQFHAGQTYGGNPTAAAAGLAVMRQLIDLNLPARVGKLGERLTNGLQSLQATHPEIGQVSGEGLLIGVEYVRNATTHEPFSDDIAFAKKVDEECRKLGLITRPSTNVQIFGPAYIISESEVDQMISIVDQAISNARNSLAA